MVFRVGNQREAVILVAVPHRDQLRDLFQVFKVMVDTVAVATRRVCVGQEQFEVEAREAQKHGNRRAMLVTAARAQRIDLRRYSGGRCRYCGAQHFAVD